MVTLVSCQVSRLLDIGNYGNGWGQFPVTKQEMVMKFAAREVLVLATETTVPVCLTARIGRVLMELSVLIVERPGLARQASKTSELLWEKPYQDQDLVASIPEESLG